MKTGTTIAGVVFKASTKQKSLTEQNSDFGKKTKKQTFFKVH